MNDAANQQRKLDASVTQLLMRLRAGEQDAIDPLWERVRQELRKQAKHRLQRLSHDTVMQTTVLLNDAFMKVLQLNLREPGVQNRDHFFALAAMVMDRLLSRHCAQKQTIKRGGQHLRKDCIPNGQHIDRNAIDPREWLVMTERQNQVYGALEKLSQREGELTRQIVVLRKALNFTISETAMLTGVSAATVKRHTANGIAVLLELLQELGVVPDGFS